MMGRKDEMTETVVEVASAVEVGMAAEVALVTGEASVTEGMEAEMEVDSMIALRPVKKLAEASSEVVAGVVMRLINWV